MKAKKIFVVILVLLGVLRTFAFSAQTSEESGALSDSLIYRVMVNFSFFSAMDEAARMSYVEEASFYVRKGAHMFLFATLAAACVMMFLVWQGKSRSAFIMCTIFAVTDELHQLFVPGRSGELRDVCVDMTGVLIIFALVRILCRKEIIDDRFSLTHTF
ncbi:MAG: VanZ family protein [Clostridia bacterium]|nr:VanZ family protein [Clostridia bacterium]